MKPKYIKRYKNRRKVLIHGLCWKFIRLEKLKDIKSVHLFFNGTVRVLHQEKCDD